MSSTVLTASVSHKAQGRSASGRNGGVRKTMSSNIDCHARFALAFAAIYKLALEGANKLLRQTTAVLQLFACGPVLFPLDWFARSQLESRSFLRYTSASLATALIHTVHGGAEPRACLTGLRV